MDTRKQSIEIFFNTYAQRTNNALRGGVQDIEGTVDSFAEYFIEASPRGINGGMNDDDFRKVIPQGYAFYKSIGITSMDIQANDITLFDDCHAMAKVHWRSSFTKKDGTKDAMEFVVIYFLQTIGDEHKIFAYITPDEHKALKDKGLI